MTSFYDLPPGSLGDALDAAVSQAVRTRRRAKTKRLITRGGAGAAEAAGRVSRIPPGHPEGYLEGFANIYTEAAHAIRARMAGAPVPPDMIYPTVRDGLIGVAFVDACVRSSKRDGAWTKLAL